MSQVPAAQRGRLQIDRGVVEKIAGQAASELPAVGRGPGGLVGLAGRGDLSARPRANVVLRDQRAAIALTVGVGYPQPLVEVSAAVRRHCADRVVALTGLQIERIDVAIRWLGVETTDEVRPA